MRWSSLLAGGALAALAGGALLVWQAGGRSVMQDYAAAHALPASEPVPSPAPAHPTVGPGPAAEAQDEVRLRLEQARAMLAAGQHNYASVAFGRALRLDKDQPAEVYADYGEALLGAGDYEGARDMFAEAIDKKPDLRRSYLGLARATEHTGQDGLAIGAYETYVHLAGPEDPQLAEIRRRLADLRKKPRPPGWRG